jgi:amino acid adenylation domain-containing protein
MSAQNSVRAIEIRPIYPYTAFADQEIEQSIPERFEKQVHLYGERLAIKTAEDSLTYNELNTTANRLARKILARRGRHIEAVALMLEHGAGVLAAMLGVLKTGKFYLVLDPSYPRERLAHMLADSGAGLIVTDAKNLPLVATLSNEVKDVSNFDALEGALSDENLGLNLSPDALAMLIYTSGSTGPPKGVMHSHKNVLVDVRNFTNAFCISSHDRWLLYTSMSFAHSVRTIYGAFLNGSAIFPYDLKKKGFGKLADWLLSNKITLMRSLPTTFRNFMATLPAEMTFPNIRILTVGGEPATRADVDLFNQHFCHPSVLVHPLGPTECLTVCWNFIPHGTRVQDKPAIGYPLQDKTVLLLDESGAEVPAGEIGEICVKSRYIALGYWRDPERTKAAFLPDPHDSTARIYRTGDLGVLAKDGCLTHMGRRDFQMKIRGYRVDPSEIEGALRTIDGVSDAVVVGRENAIGGKQLIAYYVPTGTAPITVTKIRNDLARVIPDFMIPDAFVRIDAIPHTPNGKIDRISLPPPSRERPMLDVAFVPPASTTENEIAQIWCGVLNLDCVGVHDNLLDLGAHSLNMTQIINRLRDEFEVQLPLSALFEAPTIASLAVELDARKARSVTCEPPQLTIGASHD